RTGRAWTDAAAPTPCRRAAPIEASSHLQFFSRAQRIGGCDRSFRGCALSRRTGDECACAHILDTCDCKPHAHSGKPIVDPSHYLHLASAQSGAVVGCWWSVPGTRAVDLCSALTFAVPVFRSPPYRYWNLSCRRRRESPLVRGVESGEELGDSNTKCVNETTARFSNLSVVAS